MAILNLVVLESGVRKQKASNTQTVDFSSVRIGTSNLEILEATGHFDFSAKKLTNIAAPAADTDASTKKYVDDAIGGIPAASTDFSDSTFRISDNTTPSKKLAFEVSAISASTVRTITVPDANLNLSTTTSGSFANSTLSNLGTTAINADLLSAADNTINAGTPANRFASVWGDFISGTSSVALRDTSQNPIMSIAIGTSLLGLYTGPFISGPSVAGTYAHMGMRSRPNTNNDAVSTESLVFFTGPKSTGSGNSGDFIAFTGAVNGSGLRGIMSLDARYIDVNSKNIVNLADPTAAQHAATKNYVDLVAQGIKPKQAVITASTAAGTLATDFANGGSVGGVTIATGQRILIKDQAAPAENGIYIVQASGAPVRATDFDSTSPVDEINGAWVGVQTGTNAGKVFVQYGTVTTVGTDAITFTWFSDMSTLSGGDMITVSGGVVSVDVSTTGGLESSNPGNAAGQLKIKLDSTSLALSSSGAKVNLDNDTLILDSTVKVNEVRSFANDNAGTISVNQVVYIKANGNVDLAKANVSGLEGVYVALVKDATILTTATGKVTVKPGALISGFSGLTPGVKQYISRATAGALTESLAGFVTNEVVYSVGYALSATEIVYQPQFEYVF